MSLAVLDWGIGGLGLFKSLREELPQSPLTYWSDAGFTPYGKVSRPVLVDRLSEVLRALVARDVTHVVIACNAASTVLKDLSPKVGSCPALVGVIEPTLAELGRGPQRSLGIIGGIRTIRSGIYRVGLTAQGHAVQQRIAQPLSAMVEAGDLTGPRVRAQITSILAPFRNLDGLIMACTHYPALSPIFATLIPEVELIDPATATMAWIKRHWLGNDGLKFAGPQRHDLILTTGKAHDMQLAARRAFGVKLATIVEVR